MLAFIGTEVAKENKTDKKNYVLIELTKISDLIIVVDLSQILLQYHF